MGIILCLIHFTSRAPGAVVFAIATVVAMNHWGIILDHLPQVSVLLINDNLSLIKKLPVLILQLPQKLESS